MKILVVDIIGKTKCTFLQNEMYIFLHNYFFENFRRGTLAERLCLSS